MANVYQRQKARRFISLVDWRVVLTPLLISTLWTAQALAQIRLARKSSPHCKQMGDLLVNQGRETRVTGLDSHCYWLTLTGESFLHLSVQHTNLELTVRIIGPRNQLIIERVIPSDSTKNASVYWLARTGGRFLVEVRPSQRVEAPESFKITVVENRNATPEDEDRVAGQQDDQAAMLLLKEGTEAGTKKALEKYQNALKKWRIAKDRQQEAETSGAIGEIYIQMGDISHALEYTNQAVSVFHEIGDRSGEAQSLNNIGAIFHNQGNVVKALEHYEKALSVLGDVKDLGTVANVLNNKGRAHKDMGNIPKAMEYFSQSLRAARDNKDVRGQCYSLVSIADLFEATGERQKALDIYNEALPLIKKIREAGLEATTLGNMGNLYHNLGENQKALNLYNQALPLARSVGAPDIVIYTLNDLGIFFHESDTQRAIAYYEQALKLAVVSGSRHHEAMIKHNLGRAHVDHSDYKKALALFNEVLAIVKDTKDKYGEARTRTSMGNLYSLMGDKQSAIESLTLALPLKREAGDKSGEADALFILARVRRDGGELLAARSDIESAIKVVEDLRESVLRMDLRATYFATLHSYYEFDVDLLMRMHKQNPDYGYDTLALEASERARARNLLALLNEARISVDGELDIDLREQKVGLLGRLGELQKRKYEKLVSKANLAEVARVDTEIDSTIEQYRNLEAAIRRKYATNTSLAAEPLLLHEIQRSLDADTLLLYYALGPTKSFLWTVSVNRAKSFELPRQTVIEGMARNVFDGAQKVQTAAQKTGNRPGKRALRDVDFTETASELSNAILGPAANDLESKRLVIVGDGILQLVPFSALPEPRIYSSPSLIKAPQTLLVDNHEIVVLPSATALDAIRNNVNEAKRPTKLIAIFADPVFEASDPRIDSRSRSRASFNKASSNKSTADVRDLVTRSSSESGVTKEGEGLQRLYFTGQEADFIESLTSGRNVIYKSFQASRSNALQKNLGDYQIIHFATHGLVNNVHPELSGIVLSLYDERGFAQDGFLKLVDIYNLRLPADLVVLSACQTAIGKQTKGEGLEALTRGFLHAGTKSVIATLWKVNDQGTARFMRFFYEAMLGPRMLRPSAALQEAQKDMKRSTAWSSPHYWSGFVLQGEWK